MRYNEPTAPATASSAMFSVMAAHEDDVDGPAADGGGGPVLAGP